MTVLDGQHRIRGEVSTVSSGGWGPIGGVSNARGYSSAHSGDLLGVMTRYLEQRVETLDRFPDTFLERALFCLTLKAGWNGQGSRAPSTSAIGRAVYYATALLSDRASEPSLSPADNGDLVLELSMRDGRSVEVHISDDAGDALLVDDGSLTEKPLRDLKQIRTHLA